MRAPASVSKSRIAGLDVLRGIAVALVVLRHALPQPFAGAGVVGVVMFFALSGHLITGLLIDELDTTGGVDWRGFYRRRARRLVPALLVMVAVWALVTVAIDPIGERAQLPRNLAAALTWTADLPHLQSAGATFHLWTLATEEQFYLLWPALLAVAFVRRSPAYALGLAGAVCGLATLATVVWTRASPDLAYALPTSWAGCFVIGAASRLLLRTHGDRLRPGPTAVPVSLVLLGVLCVVPLRGHALTYLVAGPAVAALTCVLVLAWRDWSVTTTALTGTLAWLGTVSYAAYLWNYPLTLWLRPSLGETAAGLVGVPLTLMAAALSWRYVEAPIADRARVRAREPALGR